MFFLVYVAKGTDLKRAVQMQGGSGYYASGIVTLSEEDARERAAAMHLANNRAYDYYLGELTMTAAISPPPPLEFKKL
jgi:hypothetical protein